MRARRRRWLLVCSLELLTLASLRPAIKRPRSCRALGPNEFPLAVLALSDRIFDSKYQAQLESIGEELGRTEKAIDRYMLGFEQGRIDLDRFGPRMEELALAAKKLEKSRDSLLTTLDNVGAAAPPAPVLDSLRRSIREAIDLDEALQAKKALIAAHVQDVEIRSRNEIYPTFRVPTAANIGAKVRTLSSQEHQSIQHPNLYLLVAGPRIRLRPKHAKVRREGYRKR